MNNFFLNFDYAYFVLLHVYVMHRQDHLLLSQLCLASLQFGWNKEPKRVELVSSVGAR